MMVSVFFLLFHGTISSDHDILTLMSDDNGGGVRNGV
jgi:hypothetical protein